MATPTKQKQSTSNQGDEHNPGQQYYDREFDSIVANYDKTAQPKGKTNTNAPSLKSLEGIGAAGEMASTAKALKEGEGSTNSRFINRFVAAGELAAKAAGPQSAVAVKVAKKGGPLGVLLIIILGMFALLGPAGVLLSHVEAGNSKFGSAGRYGTKLHYNKMKKMVANEKTKAACKKSRLHIRCQMGSVPKKTIDRYKSQGFTVLTTKVGIPPNERHVIRALTFPDLGDGKPRVRITSGDAYVKAIKADIRLRDFDNRVHFPRLMAFLGSRAGDFLRKRFGVDRSKLDTDNKEEKDADGKKKTNAEKFNEEIGLKPDGTADQESVKSRITNTFKTRATKLFSKTGKGFAAILGMTCQAYSSINLAIMTIMLIDIAQAVQTMMPVIKLTMMIKYDGSYDAALFDTTTKMFTEPDKDKKNATDYPELQSLFHPVKGAAAKQIPAIESLVKVRNFIDEKMLFESKKSSSESVKKDAANSKGVGKRLFSKYCAAIGSAFAQAIGLVACGVQIALIAAGGTIGGTVVPGLGNAAGLAGGTIGGIVGCAVQLLGPIAAKAVGPAIMEKMITPLIKEYLLDEPVNASSRGKPVAKSFATAIGAINNGANQTMGLRPAKASDDPSVFTQGSEEDQLTKQAIAYAARKDPLNIANSYSVTGSLAQTIATSLNTPTNQSSGNALLSYITRAFNPLTYAPRTLATGAMPITINQEVLQECNQALLVNIGAGCDPSTGQPIMVYDHDTTDLDIDDVIDYMIKNKYIEENYDLKNISVYRDSSNSAGGSIGSASEVDALIGGIPEDATEDEIKDILGAAVPDIGGDVDALTKNKYELFVEYCGAARSDMWGGSADGLTNPNVDWADGTKCLGDDEEIPYFQAFYAYCSMLVNEELEASSNPAPKPVAGEEGTTPGGGDTPIGDINNPVGGAINEGLKNMPTKANTGVSKGVSLKVYNGRYTTTKAGEVIENLIINGSINVKHPNVKIRNVRVNNSSSGENSYAIFSNDNNAPGTVIENVEVNMLGRGAAAIATRDKTIVRNTRLTGHGDGIKVWHNSLYEHNYIIMQRKPGSSLHLDGTQSEGKSNYIMRYNYVNTPANTGGNIAIFAQSWVGGKNRKISNVVIENNWVCGGNHGIMIEDGKNTNQQFFDKSTRVVNNTTIPGCNMRYNNKYTLEGNLTVSGNR